MLLESVNLLLLPVEDLLSEVALVVLPDSVDC